MQCPVGDGDLISHTTYGENNLTVSYSTCPTCRGHWMESFSANFIRLTPQELQKIDTKARPQGELKCPVCQRILERATGENIPDTVWVYTCPDSHGYFFPNGQLAAFKKAQQTKIEYHKLWNLPLPSVASVLLGGFLFVALTGGLLAGLKGIQDRQTTTSQAQQVLSAHHAYVIPETHEVLLTAQTTIDATMTARIPSLTTMDTPLITRDRRTHSVVITGVAQGSYTYTYSIQTAGGEIVTESFSFVMPR